MAAQVRGRLRGSFEPWPGYVDVLSTLLMVIIFVLLIFVIAQFFLSDALSGRDEELERLSRQVSELTATLALERQTAESLRTNVGDLSGELQTSVSTRDDLERRLKTAMEERSAMAASLAQSQAQLAALQETQAVLEARIVEGQDVVTARDQLNERLTVIIAERDALATRLADTESALADLRLAFAQKSDEAARLAAERDQLLQQLAALGLERDDLTAQLTDTQARLSQTQSSLDQTAADLSQTRDTLATTQTRLDETLARASTAEADLGQTRDTLAQTSDTLAQTQAQLEALKARLADTEIKLAATERRLAEALAALDETQQRLNAATSRILSLQLAIAEADASAREERGGREQVQASLEDAYKQIEADQAKVETLLGDIAILESLRDELQAQVLSTQEQAEEELSAQRSLGDEARRQLQLLNAQMLAARQRIAEIEAALDLREAELASRDETIKTQESQIAELGDKLNEALLSKVQELEKYRSEFFGRLREVLGSRQDVQVQGDRFVFQSEVLFDTGSAQLGAGGMEQLAQFAQTLKEIAATIPPGVDWLLRVDGHTDNRPINKPEFPSNWELSTARAIAVVKFLETQGIEPKRLAATGFGEFRPLSLGEDEDSLRLNRRIELKLDQR